MLTFFIRDVSRRKKAEQEQSRYAAELERSNRELEQFAYVASHDLQEPLRKIRTFGDRLQMKCADKLDEVGQPTACRRMQSAAERMQTLIDGLLSLSRVTTQGQSFVAVDLAEIAREVVSDLEVQIEKVGGRVEVGHLPTIQADPLQMRQLLQNLIANGLKFHRVEQPPVVKVQGRFVHGRAASQARRLGRRGAVQDRRRGQRHRFRAEAPGADFRRLPAAAPARRVRGDGNRVGAVPQDRRAPRRNDHRPQRSRPGQRVRGAAAGGARRIGRLSTLAWERVRAMAEGASGGLHAVAKPSLPALSLGAVSGSR